VKKSVVALLITLALIVLISPGIVGRLAEQSMQENLDWASTESLEFVITSQGFDRGWFSSAGRHRIEFRDGGLQGAMLRLFGADTFANLPAIIVDTRLDHGLIPVTSLSREQGSLKPGLGSAISTFSLELADGETIALPGTIYSTLSLAGELQSNFVLQADGFKSEKVRIDWGATNILVTTNPTTGSIDVKGSIDSISIQSPRKMLRFDKIELTIQQRMSPFGFAVGDFKFSWQAMTEGTAADPTKIGPVTISSNLAVDDDRVNGHVTLELENARFADFGTAAIVANIRFENADGVAIANLKRALEKMPLDEDVLTAFESLDNDLRRLLAAGIELHIEQLEVSLPQGSITSTFSFIVAETDLDGFTWTAPLLALDARADISLPVELVELALDMNPQLNAAIGMGFLRKNGAFYVMEAAFEKGLLTINGAPMPIPLPGLQQVAHTTD